MAHNPQGGLVHRLLEIVDNIFLVIFARYRRKMGHANVEAAWRNASNQVSGYFVLPVAAVALALFIIVYSFLMAGPHFDHKLRWQIAAGAVWLTIAMLLDRRFRKYLSDVPALPSDESREDKLLILRFRAFAIGVFFLACLMAVLMRRS